MKTKILVLCAVMASACGVALSASSTKANTQETGRMETFRHICGVRFCGWHDHHHCHNWCDRRGHHWHCPGHD